MGGCFNAWSDEGFGRLYSDTFREDVTLEGSRKWSTEQRARVGSCRVARPLRIFTTRSGRFELECERARVAVRLDLSNDGQRVDGSVNQWTYPVDAARVALAEGVLAELGRARPKVDTEGDEAPRSVEEAGRALAGRRMQKKRGARHLELARRRAALCANWPRARCG